MLKNMTKTNEDAEEGDFFYQNKVETVRLWHLFLKSEFGPFEDARLLKLTFYPE